MVQKDKCPDGRGRVVLYAMEAMALKGGPMKVGINALMSSSPSLPASARAMFGVSFVDKERESDHDGKCSRWPSGVLYLSQTMPPT